MKPTNIAPVVTPAVPVARAPVTPLTAPPILTSTPAAAPVSGSVTPQVLEVRIDEVVLHGVAARDARRVAGALQTELTRLLEQHGLPADLPLSVEVEQLHGPPARVRRGAAPAALGIQAARSLYRGLSE